ncbi:MAG: Succinylarginine dihydrolase [uncultured Sphingomonadaceae bacterium]|uniref:N-succinylarginine dihydrolase n=1 Tax=uncultured Sphingomonadaceae bacterium TaxID=169976 RepID=A0A6J4SF96_9SPHN|nr:MAG: Succinylarginine dihydrolase [uncultured Sphingomonadaceae bacterium]
MLAEINFDGIVGPTHNYAGLSLGNLAATRNAGAIAYPRAASLEGVAKMRANLALGLTQGILLPHARPNRNWLAALGTDPVAATPAIRANAMSASPMWAANAATVSPAPDTADGRCHLTVANLRTMPHRSHEWPGAEAQLRIAFADASRFAVHAPVPNAFGDEGAANHMRIGPRHDAPCTEIFVYGESGGPFPARQHREASAAVARLHGLDPERTLFVRQSDEAIAAGAFHNDVVAVANEYVLFAHERAFAEPQSFYDRLTAAEPEVVIVEVPQAEVSLADAISSYLFNAQLVTPAEGVMTLIVPAEARETPAVWAYLQRLVAGNGPIRRVEVVDVRQSMANGGGPACLRLRVVADPATIDPRFLVDAAKLGRIAAVIGAEWPESIGPDDLGDAALIARVERARGALYEELGLGELL